MKKNVSYCPACKNQNAWNAVECDHCGESLTAKGVVENEIEREGFAYGQLAGFALVMGQIATAIGAGLCLYVAVVSIFRLDFFSGFFNGMIMFFIMLALYVTFKRVENL